MPTRPAWLAPVLALTALFMIAVIGVVLVVEGRALVVPLAVAAATTAMLAGVELERRRSQL